MSSGVVFGAERRVVVVRVRRNERMKEFGGGRRPSKGHSGIKGEMNRQVSLECEPMRRTEPSIRSVGKERMIVLFNWKTLQRDCHFVEDFVNLERRRRRVHNDQSQRSNKRTERIQRHLTKNQRNSTRTR